MNQNEIRELLDYNPDTGIFTWRSSVKGSKGIGKEAGTVTSKGYRDVCIRGKKYGLHRLAFLFMTGVIPNCVDHKNGIKSDNRWNNLRGASYRENGYNYKGTGTSGGFKNVYVDPRHPNRYFVQVNVNGKQKRFGTYSSAEEANKVAIEIRNEYHGEFACHGSNLPSKS